MTITQAMTGTVLGDWGSTRLRLWWLEHGVVRDQRDGPGIGALDQPPAETLRAALAPWLVRAHPARIVLCGMAGARNGLHEVDYCDCPAGLDAWRDVAQLLAFDAIPLRIAAGVAGRDAAGTPDVMRGEETQVFGAMALHPHLATGHHRIILPGTHSKWVTLQDGRIAALRTFFTGELYALLLQSSLMTVGAADRGEAEPDAFAEGLARASSGLLGNLFSVRAAQLRDQRSPGWARSFLSGLVIGTELGDMLGGDEAPESLTLIGEPRLTAHYADALGDYGARLVISDGTDCAIAGLRMLDGDA